MSNIELSSTPNAPAPPWVGWCVAAILMTTMAAVLVTVLEILSGEYGAQSAAAAGVHFSSMLGVLMGGFLFPMIVAALFMIWPKWRTRRFFFRTMFWISILTFLGSLGKLGNLTGSNMHPFQGDTYTIKMPCSHPKKQNTPAGAAPTQSYFCDTGFGREHYRITEVGPGAVDRGKTKLDAAGNYMMAQIFKDGKMTSATAVNVAGAQGMEYFFQGRLDEKNTGEVRLRIFVVRGYLYQIVFLGLNAGSSKSPLVQTVFDSFALKPEPATK